MPRYDTWNEIQKDAFYKVTCARDDTYSACTCSGYRTCTSTVDEDPSPTLTLQVPLAYLGASFWQLGGDVGTMKLFSFSLKRIGRNDVTCDTLVRSYVTQAAATETKTTTTAAAAGGPTITSDLVTLDAVGQCRSRAYNCSAGPKYKCDTKGYTCLQDQSGVYASQSSCQTTCYDPTAFINKVAIASGTGTSSSSGSTGGGIGAASSTVERFVCDSGTFRCTRKTFKSSATKKANHYSTGVDCNSKCAPLVKYQCSGPPSYQCNVNQYGAHDTRGSCKQAGCFATGDAGCSKPGAKCRTASSKVRWREAEQTREANMGTRAWKGVVCRSYGLTNIVLRSFVPSFLPFSPLPSFPRFPSFLDHSFPSS